ncbi:hypothetical protein EVAR_19986_1 [Eumeta japonica]|uniref:Uncharacterized protein n=1 Tax=Eumeta variegata TaxID=151549 RepID=A0A4C1V9W8_EUMVA|nr:hypothetical protein EVAR_19986_1 [Eumeta japonica]
MAYAKGNEVRKSARSGAYEAVRIWRSIATRLIPSRNSARQCLRVHLNSAWPRLIEKSNALSPERYVSGTRRGVSDCQDLNE